MDFEIISHVLIAIKMVCSIEDADPHDLFK